MQLPTHECPARGCTKRVRHEELACAPHWTKLPWRLRTNLSHAFRRHDYDAHQTALEAALDWYFTHDNIDTAPESRGGETTTTVDTGCGGGE